MKHANQSASPCDLKRQRLRDRLNRQAKPTSNNLTDELCTFSAAVGADSLPSLVRASAAVRRLTSLPSPGGENQGEGGLFQCSKEPFLQIKNQKSKIINAHKGADFLRDFYTPVRLALFYFCFNSA